MLFNFLQANFEGSLFLGPIVSNGALIGFGGQTDNAAQGSDHILGANGMIAAGADAVLGTPGGFDDQMVTGLIVITGRVKEVDLLARTELYIYHFNRLRLILDRHILRGQNFVFHVKLLVFSAEPIPDSRRRRRGKHCSGYIRWLFSVL